MKPLPEPANDNGKPEDHLAVATVAFHTAIEGLPVDVLARRVGIEVEAEEPKP